MIAAALLLCLFLTLGILTRSYNTWTRLSIVLVILGALILFYLT